MTVERVIPPAPSRGVPPSGSTAFPSAIGAIVPELGRTTGGRHPATSLALLVLLVGLLAAEALAPFRLDVPWPEANGARRVPAGIAFDGPSRVYTPRPPEWLPAVRSGSSFELTIAAAATEPFQPQVARLFAVSRDYHHADIVVAQEHDDLVVRVRRTGSDLSGEPPARVPDVFSSRALRRIVVRREGPSLEVAVDGRTGASLDLGNGGLRRWRTDFRVALGNEHLGGRAWKGTIAEATVEVGGRSWDYVHGDIRIPRRVWFVPERLRHWTTIGSAVDLAVSGLHGLTFVPIGMLAVLADERRRRRRAVALVLALDAGLFLAKVVASGRHPSAVDLATQAIGGLIGVALGLAWSRSHGGAADGADTAPA